MIALVLAAAAHTLSLTCVVDPARKIVANGNAVTSELIKIQPEVKQWAFNLRLRDTEDRLEVTLDWPDDPVTAGKAIGGIPIGSHDYAFTSLHGGPCLFTQTACMTMYTLSEQPDGTADILIQPAAIMGSGEWGHPFQVSMKGRCTPKGGSR